MNPAHSSHLPDKAGTSVKLNYVPFCFDYASPHFYDRNWFKQYQNDEWRKWADSVSPSDVQKIILNLINYLIERAEMGKPGAANIGLALMADQSLQALQYLIKTQGTAAAGYLVPVLKRAVDRLNYDNEASTSVMRNVAQTHIFWPINYSPNTFFNTDQDQLQKRLNIGDDYFLKLKSDGGGKKQRKSFDFKSPKNQMVLRMIETLSANRYQYSVEIAGDTIPEWVRKCRKLPPFSVESIDKWAEIGWEAICDAYDGKPETHAELRKIGKHRGIDKKKFSAKESAIRSEIKAEIKPMLKKLAQHR